MCVATTSDELEGTFLTALARCWPLSLVGQKEPILRVEQPASQPTLSPKVQPPLYNPSPTAASAPAHGLVTTRSETKYHPSPNMLPLGEVANGDPGEGIIQVHVPFSMSDLVLCKEKLLSVS